jgi:hypothetical protein
MSMPGDYPLEIYHGDSYHWQFKLWIDEAKTQALDLTGAVVKAEIRDKPAGLAIFPLDCEVSLPNIIEAILPASLSDTLPIASDMVWDIQITFPDGSVNTLLSGKVKVTQDVTDAVDPGAARSGGTVKVMQPQLVRAPRR